MPQYNENVIPASSQTVGTLPQPWQAGYFNSLYVNGVALNPGITFSTVTFSATPVFAVTSVNAIFKMTLTGNVTSSSLTGAVQGFITFILVQNITGGWTLAWPTNVLGPIPIGSASNAVTVQTFVYDGANAYPIAPGSIYP